jgi:hypothetical protein
VTPRQATPASDTHDQATRGSGTWGGAAPGGGGVPAVTAAERASFRQLQAYEDAIAYRTARLAAPCPRCGPAPCDDHAADLDLISAYRRAATQRPPQAAA